MQDGDQYRVGGIGIGIGRAGNRERRPTCGRGRNSDLLDRLVNVIGLVVVGEDRDFVAGATGQ